MTRIIDAYELSAMQAGMLFYAVSGEDPDLYIDQVTAKLHASLDEACFLRARQQVAERHPVLQRIYGRKGLGFDKRSGPVADAS